MNHNVAHRKKWSCHFLRFSLSTIFHSFVYYITKSTLYFPTIKIFSFGFLEFSFYQHNTNWIPRRIPMKNQNLNKIFKQDKPIQNSKRSVQLSHLLIMIIRCFCGKLFITSHARYIIKFDSLVVLLLLMISILFSFVSRLIQIISTSSS